MSKMKKCKQCQWEFYKFTDLNYFTQAIFRCPKCKHTTKGFTNPMGEFLGKAKGKRKDKSE